MIIKMETKTFSIVTSISMVLALTIAVLSIIGVAITGLYPGIIVLLLVVWFQLLLSFTLKKLLVSPMIFREIITRHSQLLICYQYLSCYGWHL